MANIICVVFLAIAIVCGISSAFQVPSATTVSTSRKSLSRKSLLVRDASATDEGTLKKVVLKNGNSQAEVYTLGACVTSFKVDGYDYLMCRPDAKFDGSKPISGGLPFCWPQFGPGAIQQHGFARNLEWEVVEEGDDKAVFKLLPNDETKAMWDKDFELTYTVSVAPGKLSTVFNVANTGAEDFEFTGALHSYYRTSSVDKIAVKGPFKGASFLDKTLDPPSMVEETDDDITVKAFIERIYPGISAGIALEDPEAGKTLKIVNKQGYEDTVVWNPYGDEGMGASGFICVESANVMNPVNVPAGGNWVGELELEGN